MAELLTAEFWARLFAIVILDLTLAGDNALVIALAVRTLRQRQQFWGRVWGTVGAVGLRLAFIAIVTILLQIPLLQLAGGLLLLWIAVKLIRQETGAEGHVRSGTSLWEAIWVIIVADAVMSLDNVLAVAAAAHGDFMLVAFGIGLSIPIVVWGSGLLARLMNRYPWIVWLGGGILGYVSGEMILKDAVVHGWVGAADVWLHYVVPIGFGGAITTLGWSLANRRRPAEIPEDATGWRHDTSRRH
jgi:YjbE family integral membrane protein